MLRAFLATAEHLGPVFPLVPRDKRPLTEHGVKDATRDESIIREWVKRWPTANLGLAAGFGWIVVDVDPRNGGDEGLRDFEERHGMLPRTWTSETGGGGWHYLYGAPVGTKVRASVARGVDCKGAGGYIAAPPSEHPSGRRYAWHPELHPGVMPITEAPDWLLDLVTERARREVGLAVGAAAQSFIGRAFDISGWADCDLPGGKLSVFCPWESEHSEGRGSRSSTVILPPTAARPLGSFKCSHGHCLRRGNVDALYALPSAALAVVASMDPEGAALAFRLIGRRRAA